MQQKMLKYLSMVENYKNLSRRQNNVYCTVCARESFPSKAITRFGKTVKRAQAVLKRIPATDSESWGQFHQRSTRSFCANSLAPVKYKPKT
jgi:hypothetical protein